ncbi:DNase I-like protein, partial [Trametes sanguinea]
MDIRASHPRVGGVLPAGPLNNEGVALYDGGRPPAGPSHGGSAWKRTRARLRVGTLNVKGYGLPTVRGISERWFLMSRIMRDHRLDILALQEAHLTNDRVTSLNEFLRPDFTVLHSQDPDSPAAACGVAFVINMRRLQEVPRVIELIPGRALLLQYSWSPSRTLTVLTIYAPNIASDNAEFWNAIRDKCQQHRLHVDVVLGDFNVVDDTIDRLPIRADPAAAVDALAELLRHLRVEDSWRRAHPTERVYTYRHSNGTSQSRLDRIYLNETLLPAAAHWTTEPTGLQTDHALVYLSLANYHAPVVGKGRWRMPQDLLTDQPFLSTMQTLGLEFQAALNALPARTADANPQTVYYSFKVKLQAAARERVKARALAGTKRMHRLQKQLDATNCDIATNPNNVELAETSALLAEKIEGLKRRSLTNRRSMAAARYWVLGERTGRYWLR